MGLSVWQYKQLEDPDLGLAKRVKLPKIGPMSLADKLFVSRLRSRRECRDIAKDLGCSVFWLRRMERCEVDSSKLVKYWGLEGA
jgi:hypothetical protein